MDVDVRQVVRAAGLIAYGVLLAGGLPLTLLLLVTAQTNRGLLIGFGCLSVALLPVARWAGSHVRALTLTALVAAALALWCAPDGRPPPGPLRAGWTGDGAYGRFSPFNLVPEIDQVSLGAVLAPDVFARIDRGKTRRILDLTMPLYRAMEADPAYRAAGSAMHLAFRDVFCRGDASGHYFAFVPSGTGRRPVLLFLHGSGGNFKSYTRFWQEWCESRGWAVVCPTYGFGDWGRDEAQDSLDRLLAALDRDPALDASRMVLAGLSNGGRGASMLAARQANRFRALALFSPVMDATVLESSRFVQAWKNRSVLVMYGDADEVIPAAYVRGAADRLAGRGVAVTRVALPGEDHFMLFSAREAVFRAMDALR